MNSTDVTVSRLKTAFEKKTNQKIGQKKLSTMQYEEMKKWGEKIESRVSMLTYFYQSPRWRRENKAGTIFGKTVAENILGMIRDIIHRLQKKCHITIKQHTTKYKDMMLKEAREQFSLNGTTD